jgi:hypothetical protein
VFGQPNELFSAAEIRTLEVRLGGGIHQLVNAETGAIKRAVNAGHRPNPNPGRRYFAVAASHSIKSVQVEAICE